MTKKNPSIKSLTFLLTTALIIVMASAVSQAQTAAPSEIPSMDMTAASKDKNLSRYASETDGVIEDGYAIPTFKNLSKTYWALAMFDLSDNQAIDSYLLINECELYRKYFNSDFELEGLREATRASITQNLASFPTKFEIMIPVGLDRYNTGTERFMIDPRSQFLGSKRLEIAVNDELEPVCNNRGESIPKYPKNFILTLNRPFLVTEVPVNPEVAQFYIEQSEKEAPTRPYRRSISKFSRIAYLRLKVTMNQFKGYGQAGATGTLADIFGTIDSYEMYADRDKTLLMYNDAMAAKQVEKKKSTGVQIPQNDQQLIESQDQESVEKRDQEDPNKTVVSPETGAVEGFTLPLDAGKAPTPSSGIPSSK